MKFKKNRLIIEPYNRDLDDGVYVCVGQIGPNIRNASITIDDNRKFHTILNNNKNNNINDKNGNKNSNNIEKLKYNHIKVNKRPFELDNEKLVELICEPSKYLATLKVIIK